MDCKDIKYYLNDYVKGFLLDEVREEIHDHLNFCTGCTKAFDELITYQSDIAIKQQKLQASKSEIGDRVQGSSNKRKSIEKFLPFISQKNSNEDFFKPNFNFRAPGKFSSGWFIISSIIFTIAFGIVLAFALFNSSDSNYSYVQKLSGYPFIESRVISDQGIIRVGERLVTDSESRARLKIGSEGEIDIEPQSVIQIVETPTSEHTLILSKGMIETRTWALPKLFSIQTPSALIRDFGADYELFVNSESKTVIQVKTGWVLMEHKNHRVLLPAETNCRSDSSIGIGTPFLNGASNIFKEALQNLDYRKNEENNLSLILNESRKQDVITLFYLLRKLDSDSRGKVFDRMSALFEMPRGITRSGVVNGEKDMLERLWTQLGIGSISLYQNL